MPLEINCAGCRNPIKKKEVMDCSICMNKFDLMCANVSSTLYKERGFRQNWKCPECRYKQPKTDNTNTPVRSASRSELLDEDIACKVLLTSPSHSNVTIRTQRRQGSEGEDDNITLGNIRDILKFEVAEMVKGQVANELKEIKAQFKDYQETIKSISRQFDMFKSVVERKFADISKDLQEVAGGMKSLQINITKVVERTSDSLLPTAAHSQITPRKSQPNNEADFSSTQSSSALSPTTFAEAVRGQAIIEVSQTSHSENINTSGRQKQAPLVVERPKLKVDVSKRVNLRNEKKNGDEMIAGGERENIRAKQVQRGSNVNLCNEKDDGDKMIAGGEKVNIRAKQVQRGSNVSVTKIQALERRRHLHVLRLTANTSTDELAAFVKEICGAHVNVKVERIKHKIAKDYASFIVSVPESEYAKLCKPEVWPVNVEFKEWIWFRRAQTRPLEEK